MGPPPLVRASRSAGRPVALGWGGSYGRCSCSSWRVNNSPSPPPPHPPRLLATRSDSRSESVLFQDYRFSCSWPLHPTPAIPPALYPSPVADLQTAALPPDYSRLLLRACFYQFRIVTQLCGGRSLWPQSAAHSSTHAQRPTQMKRENCRASVSVLFDADVDVGRCDTNRCEGQL